MDRLDNQEPPPFPRYEEPHVPRYEEPHVPRYEEPHAGRKVCAALVGVAATGLIVAAVPLCAAGQEPFVTWYYVICWFGLIFALDAASVFSGDDSIVLGTGPRAGRLLFPALLFWSAAIWFFFELFNFRLANWYYVNVPNEEWVRIVGSFLSFATVLPALFAIEGLLERAGLFRGWTWPVLGTGRLDLARRGVRPLLVSTGAACLILPLLWPAIFFPLVWLGVAFLLAPLNRVRLERSLLSDLETGQVGRLLRILAAGMACGLIWEFLNSFARIRWIYTVPFLDELKLFEMPPLGFLGFPPFAIECVVAYGALVGFGLAPSFGHYKRRAGTFAVGARLLLPILGLAAVGMWFVLEGMMIYNIDSVEPRSADLELPALVRELAVEKELVSVFDLHRTLNDSLVKNLLAREGVDVEKVSALTGLATFRGIGTRHARALSDLGIVDRDALADCDPEDLAQRLTTIEKDRAPLNPARVKTWIRSARRSRAARSRN